MKNSQSDKLNFLPNFWLYNSYFFIVKIINFSKSSPADMYVAI